MNKNVLEALVTALKQYAQANNLNPQPIGEALKAVFELDVNFLEKVEAFDEVFDNDPKFEELREMFFDLLMINFFTADVAKLEADYLESKEWEDIEEETLDRGTELLNLLLYINECHDEKIKPGLEDFLKEFLLVDEDEFQDEFHIYEDIISNQQLAESSIEEICTNAKILKLSEDMQDLFVPFLSFFLHPQGGEQYEKEIAKFSANSALDAAIYSLLTQFNKVN